MKNKEWCGEGVPPIGTICEYYCSEGDEWRKCEVVAYYLSNTVAVDVLDSSAVCLHFGLGLFRPVRTPEQIAEEERLAAIDEMMDFVGSYSTLRDAMGLLYDAGYRKV